MQNNLGESLKKKISDEADNAAIEFANKLKNEGHPSSFARVWDGAVEWALSHILSNPGDYGLAGVVSESRRKFLKEQAHTALELLKGYTPEQRENWGNGLRTVEEFAGYILELTSESATPDRVGELEQLIKNVRTWCDETDYDDMPAEDIIRAIKRTIDETLEP
jgi:hypothetical protein